MWSARSYYSSSPPGEQVSRGLKAAELAAHEKCGTASRICKIELEEKAADCHEKNAQRKVEEILADPLSREECQKVQVELSHICPEECHLSLESMIVVPGKLRTDFLPIPDESGECVIKARRDVAMRALCVPD